MAYTHFSRNGDILPVSEASVPLGDIAYAYGFGVYETVRVTKGRALFLEEHCERLMRSARIIGIEHRFSPEFVAESVGKLIDANEAENCNVKILLVGSAHPEGVELNMLCLNPLYPDRRLYKEGAHTITKQVERPFAHAKTLNMLPSYLAHRDARRAGAYDALLIDRHGHITEGTSTNFFAMKDRTIYGPPESDILPGVTRAKVLDVAGHMGFKIKEQDITPESLGSYDGLFLTGTSVKIMPVHSVDETLIGPPCPGLLELMQAFDDFMAAA